jgi:hypothetical protein
VVATWVDACREAAGRFRTVALGLPEAPTDGMTQDLPDGTTVARLEGQAQKAPAVNSASYRARACADHRAHADRRHQR